MAFSRVGKIGVATVQLMCLVHLINTHMFEVRSVCARRLGILTTTVQRCFDGPDHFAYGRLGFPCAP